MQNSKQLTQQQQVAQLLNNNNGITDQILVSINYHFNQLTREIQQTLQTLPQDQQDLLFEHIYENLENAFSYLPETHEDFIQKITNLTNE